MFQKGLVFSAATMVAAFLLFHVFTQTPEPSASPKARVEINPQESSQTPPRVLTIDIDGAQSNDVEHWLTQNTRRLFDHFLLRYQDGEEEMWVAFKAHCKPLSYCPGLTALFKRYIDYKLALSAIDTGPIRQADGFYRRLDLLKDLRARFFTEVEKLALFAGDEHWDENALQRLAIYYDDALDSEQKQALLDAHFAGLPKDQLDAIQPTYQLQKLQQMTLSNGNPYNMLAAEFGHTAAQRLVEVTQKQEQWKSRVNAFLEASRELTETLSDNPQAAEYEINALKQSSFDEKEQKRLAVFVANPQLLNKSH